MKTMLVFVVLFVLFSVAASDDGVTSVSDIMRAEARVNAEIFQSAVTYAIGKARDANTKVKEYAFVKLALTWGYAPAGDYSLALLGTMSSEEAAEARALADVIIRSESRLLAGMLIPGAIGGSF